MGHEFIYFVNSRSWESRGGQNTRKRVNRRLSSVTRINSSERDIVDSRYCGIRCGYVSSLATLVYGIHSVERTNY